MLLFLIALPLVNCSRRNTLRIEELDDNLSVKGYDHGKRENTMNQPMNAYFRKTEPRKYVTEKIYSVTDVCIMLSEASSKCKKSSTAICNATKSTNYAEKRIKDLERMRKCVCTPEVACYNCQILNKRKIRLFH